MSCHTFEFGTGTLLPFRNHGHIPATLEMDFPPTLLKLFWIFKIGSENQTCNITCLLLRRLTLRFLRNISSTVALAFQSQWQIFPLHPEDWQLHSAVTTPKCLDLSCTFTTLSASEPSCWSLRSNSVHLSLASSFSGKITYHCWCISTEAAVVPHQLLLCGRSKAAKDVRTLEAKAKQLEKTGTKPASHLWFRSEVNHRLHLKVASP